MKRFSTRTCTRNSDFGLDLRVRLASIGIDCRANRRAALLQLSAEVPPAVLADMLNLAPSTAVKWVEWAGGNWSNYLASRRGVGVQ